MTPETFPDEAPRGTEADSSGEMAKRIVENRTRVLTTAVAVINRYAKRKRGNVKVPCIYNTSYFVDQQALSNC